MAGAVEPNQALAHAGVTASVVTSYTQHKYPILSRYHVGQHPLAKEGQSKRLEPLPETRAAFIKALTREMTSDGQGTLDPRTVKKYQDKMVLEGLGENVDLMYAREFQRWLRGVSVFNEPSLTPWGHRNMFHVPGVVDYLRELIQMRFDYQQSLMHLYMLVPQTLFDLELIYKYIVLQFGLVIPRGDGVGPGEGVPNANDPRSFMGISGMLSFLDDYQLTSFRERDLPLTDQSLVDAGDKDPNVISDLLDRDYDTLNSVGQGAGPGALMPNGQPDTNGATTPAPAPPDQTAAILAHFKQQSKMLATHLRQMNDEAAARKRDHDQDRQDRERRHQEKLAQMQTDHQRLLADQPVDQAKHVVEQYEQAKAAQQAKHDAEMKRMGDEHKRWREDQDRQMAAVNARVAAAEATAAVSATRYQALQEEHQQLKQAHNAAQAASARAAAAARPDIDKALKQAKDEFEAERNEIHRQYKGTLAEWDALVEGNKAKITQLTADLQHWQTVAQTASADSTEQLAAMANAIMTNNALAAENQRLRAEVEAQNNQAALADAELRGALAAELARQQSLHEQQMQQLTTNYAQAHGADAETRDAAFAEIQRMSAELAAARAELEQTTQTAKDREAKLIRVSNLSKMRARQVQALQADAEAAKTLAAEQAKITEATEHELSKIRAALAYFRGISESSGVTAAARDAEIAQLRTALAAASNAPANAAPSHEQSVQAQLVAHRDTMVAVYNVADTKRQELATHGHAVEEPTKDVDLLASQEHYNDLVRQPEHIGDPAKREEVRVRALWLAADTLHKAQQWQIKQVGSKLVSDADRTYALDAFAAVFDAPLEFESDEYRKQYAGVVSAAFNQTMHALYGTTDDVANYGEEVYNAIMAGDVAALDVAMADASATANVSAAFNVLMSNTTVQQLAAGLNKVGGVIQRDFIDKLNSTYTSAQLEAGRGAAPGSSYDSLALTSMEVGESSANDMSAVISSQLAYYAAPENLHELTSKIGASSALMKAGQSILATGGSELNYAQEAGNTVQLLKSMVDQGASPLQALAYAGVTVDQKINEWAVPVYTATQAAEAEQRRLTDDEYALLHQYSLAVVAKEALLFLRANVIGQYADFVNKNPEGGYAGFDQRDLAALNRVYQQVQNEREDADRQLSLVGHHVLRSRLAHGVAKGLSVEQYTAAVQITSTHAPTAASNQLAIILSHPASAEPTGNAAELASARTQQDAIATAHNAIQTYADARKYDRAGIISAASAALANNGDSAQSSSQLVVYVARNLEGRLGDVTEEDANSLDLALYALADARYSTTEENQVAFAEARAFRALASPEVTSAARHLNDASVRGELTPETSRVSLGVLQRALKNMEAETLVHEVLQAYIAKVEGHLRSQRAHGAMSHANPYTHNWQAIAVGH